MPIITLTTDFGSGSPYVAAMKGAIWSLATDANVVDLTHAISPQDLRQAAIALVDAAFCFPPQTIHVVVVDPGVGTERRIVYAAIGTQRFIAPDNGLLSLAAQRCPLTAAHVLAAPQYWRADVSATFHGRDIMAPAAAHLALGITPAQLGPPAEELVQFDWPEPVVAPGRITGSIWNVDSFGNLITNISRELLADLPTSGATITCSSAEIRGIAGTYGNAPRGTLVAIIGSGNRLELAIVNGSAAAALGVDMGAEVVIRW